MSKTIVTQRKCKHLFNNNNNNNNNNNSVFLHYFVFWAVHFQ